MDTGKIFLGIAFIAFSVAMVINPATAAGCNDSSQVANRNIYTVNCDGPASLFQNPDYTAFTGKPAINWINPENPPQHFIKGSLSHATHPYER